MIWVSAMKSWNHGDRQEHPCRKRSHNRFEERSLKEINRMRGWRREVWPFVSCQEPNYCTSFWQCCFEGNLGEETHLIRFVVSGIINEWEAINYT